MQSGSHSYLIPSNLKIILAMAALSHMPLNHHTVSTAELHQFNPDFVCFSMANPVWFSDCGTELKKSPLVEMNGSIVDLIFKHNGL